MKKEEKRMEVANIEERLLAIEEKLNLLSDSLLPQKKRKNIEGEREEKKTDAAGGCEDKSPGQGLLEQQLLLIEEIKKDCKDVQFLKYLEEMERLFLNESVRLEDMAANLNRNYESYLAQDKTKVQLTQERAQLEQQPVLQPQQSAPATHLQKEAVQEEIREDWSCKKKEQSKKDRKLCGAAQGEEGKKLDLEFGIGGVLLSIVGALFIIAAFVIFGMNYMGSFLQGVILYVLGLVVIVFSEFVIKRSLEKFSTAMTALGIGILYTATIINYLYLHTINAFVAILLTLVVSAASVFFSQKRDSTALRLVGVLGAYISFAPVSKFLSAMDFVIPVVMILIINAISLLLPLTNNQKLVSNVTCFANMLFAVAMTLVARKADFSKWILIAFLLGTILWNHILYLKTQMSRVSIGVYTLSMIVLSFLVGVVLYDFMKHAVILGVILYGVMLAGCFFMFYNKKARMVGLYCFSVFAPLMVNDESSSACFVMLAVVLLLYKLMTRFKELRYANIAYSVFCAIVFLSALSHSIGTEYFILAVFVISVLTMKYDKLVHSLLLVGLLEAFSFLVFEQDIAFPLAFAMLLLCFAFFTFVDVYSLKGNKIFAGVIFAWNVVMVLGMMLLSQPLSLTICLVCELGYLFLLFSQEGAYVSPRFQGYRYQAGMIFLTYMVFLYDIDIPLIASVLLMVLAVISVTLGFIFKQKGVRVYGLLLAFFVCAKLLLIDFKGQQSADRILLFFFVGILTLAISYLYMRIERNLQEEEKNEKLAAIHGDEEKEKENENEEPDFQEITLETSEVKNEGMQQSGGSFGQ